MVCKEIRSQLEEAILRKLTWALKWINLKSEILILISKEKLFELIINFNILFLSLFTIHFSCKGVFSYQLKQSIPFITSINKHKI
ncbi:hypothetical protein BpHYR1_002386 [Brachionus plicatilis]|uniref:Uncharacterized protein n=1 Tax=Brachionus plicatilis TaxID=10195 RepID=A0A3M7QH06_BRAPC|nr:hypothetical protein BpHYR1_002386 [Brachionus plicatilis]